MIKTKIYFFTLISLSILLIGCSKDDKTGSDTEFVAAFENQSISFSTEETQKEIHVIFSQAAPQNGTINISFQIDNMVYGEDFKTTPSANSGILEIPVKAGANQTSFLFHKLTPNPIDGEPEKSVEFSIVEVNLPSGITQGNTNLLVTYAESASLGGSFAPNVGGPNEPNQVYVDLSAQTETVVLRDTWDLAFYSGAEFRVKLNSSLYMMAAELQTTDIDAVTVNDVVNLQPKMAFLAAGSDIYVDQPSGNINETVIEEISATLEENKVYLLKMGNEIGTATPTTGSVGVAGQERGWKKIRIVQDGNEYLLQYADLGATTHKEIKISKDPNFNFTFFSFSTESVVSVEPTKGNWDLNFSTFIEVLDLPSGGLSAYGFSDYVKTNVLAKTKAYRVSTKDFSYENFSMANVSQENFEIDQRTIGSSWRSVTPPDRFLIDNIFYIIQDSDGNIYKLKFTALMNENGVRGYPEFQYDLLK